MNIHDNEEIKHESFGVIQISRISGAESNLFGSSIEHQHTIMLRIHPAKVIRNLSRDWIVPESCPFIEVEMSQNQWSEAITSLNMGAGTPCTIRETWHDGKRKVMELPPHQNKRKQFDDEFNNSIKEQVTRAKNQRKNILEALDGKVSKKLYSEISTRISSMYRIIDDSIPFIKTQFTEQMDKTETEAKGEIEAFFLKKIHDLGMEGIKEQIEQEKAKQIERKEKKDAL